MTANPDVPLIIDTDAGSDDLLALAFLLSLPDVRIEAIAIGTGLAHAQAGARNVLRFLQLGGRADIPVYVGREDPLEGGRAFPAEWRTMTDELPGVDLPAAQRRPEATPAAEYLAARFAQSDQPFVLLALGGLTNVADALTAAPRTPAALRELVIMGGAVNVPGNLGDVGERENTTAEWNFYVDADAARRVFESGVPIRMIPLDATNDVPLDRSYIAALQDTPSPLARAVVQVLEMSGDFLDDGYYFAWDPLAAVALVDPAVVRSRSQRIAIVTEPPDVGRSIAVDGQPNAQVAYEADAERFRRWFVGALRRQ